MTTRVPVCFWCLHLRSPQAMTCDAFPSGIPQLIALGRDGHEQAVEGDQGIQFAARSVSPGDGWFESHPDPANETRVKD